MGIFDMFLGEERRIQKSQRTLTNRDVQAEDRDAAARWLADNATPKALLALLTRFDMNLENQLKDKTEKDFVYGLLVGMGEKVHRPLDRTLEKCRQIAYPIRMQLELLGEERTVSKVFELLEIERSKDDFKPQKKIDLLVWMADRRHPEAIRSVQPFLEDFDEGVRYAAAEVIVAQQDDAGRPLLDAVLANPKEDSNRLRVRLADVFVGRRWPIGEAAAAHLPSGFSARDGRVVSG
ncbi:MAG: hypothetical protein ABMA64_33560 [Myxococcota bacterium]